MRNRVGGFTFTEVLVAVLLMMVVLALAMSFFTGGFRYFVKGEDAQTSVQEAAILMSRLRSDFVRLCFRPSSASHDFAFQKSGSRESRVVTFDVTAHTLSVARTQASSGVGGESSSRFRFFVPSRTTGEPVEVSWTYQPSRSAIVRQEGAEQPTAYAIPRLQEFRLEMEVQPSVTGSTSTSAPPPIDLFTVEPGGPFSHRLLWFKVQFLVKSARTESAIATTQVDLESMVFPKHFNKRRQAAWRSRS